MALKWSRLVAEVALAFGGGVVWFAVSATILAGLPSAAIVVVGMTAMDVLVVLAVAHYWGIHAAVPVGVASVVALDWHYIPPTHESAVPDGRNAAALAVYLVAGVLLGQLALAARRRAEVSERARAQLADEQAALRRVATLVARETSPAEVFAAVTEEVGRLLSIDIATMLRYESDGGATVVAAWSRSGSHIPIGSRLRLEGENVAAMVLSTSRPARIDDFETCYGFAGRAVAGAGRPVERRKPDHRRRPPVGRDGRSLRLRHETHPCRDRVPHRGVHRARGDGDRQRRVPGRAHGLQDAGGRGRRPGPAAHRA